MPSVPLTHTGTRWCRWSAHSAPLTEQVQFAPCTFCNIDLTRALSLERWLLEGLRHQIRSTQFYAYNILCCDFKYFPLFDKMLSNVFFWGGGSKPTVKHDTRANSICHSLFSIIFNNTTNTVLYLSPLQIDILEAIEVLK